MSYQSDRQERLISTDGTLSGTIGPTWVANDPKHWSHGHQQDVLSTATSTPSNGSPAPDEPSGPGRPALTAAPVPRRGDGRASLHFRRPAGGHIAGRVCRERARARDPGRRFREEALVAPLPHPAIAHPATARGVVAWRLAADDSTGVRRRQCGAFGRRRDLSNAASPCADGREPGRTGHHPEGVGPLRRRSLRMARGRTIEWAMKKE